MQWHIQTSNCNACLKFVSQCYSSKLNLKKKSFGYDRAIAVDAEGAEDSKAGRGLSGLRSCGECLCSRFVLF